MRLPVPLRTALAMACAGALASAPLLAPVSASASAERAVAPRAAAAMPHITAKVTKRGINLKGTSGLRAGRVHLSVQGKGAVEFATFKRGYDADAFIKDVNTFGAKNDIKALKRALAHTTILGGLAPGGSGTIVLPKAGSYTAFSLGQRGAVQGPTFRVAGPVRTTKAPKTDGRILAKRGLSWGGSSSLPASGRFLFKNKGDTGVPHFVSMQQVAEGTTVDDVLTFLQSEGDGPPPSWLLRGSLETGSLSPGRSMTVDYDLPPGQYAVLCFFPDPKMQGMPHAMMGMIEMIHLT